MDCGDDTSKQPAALRVFPYGCSHTHKDSSQATTRRHKIRSAHPPIDILGKYTHTGMRKRANVGARKRRALLKRLRKRSQFTEDACGALLLICKPFGRTDHHAPPSAAAQRSRCRRGVGCRRGRRSTPPSAVTRDIARSTRDALVDGHRLFQSSPPLSCLNIRSARSCELRALWSRIFLGRFYRRPAEIRGGE